MVKIFELEPYDAFQKLLHGESEDEGQPEATNNKKRKRDDDFNEKSAKKPKGKGKYVCPPLEYATFSFFLGTYMMKKHQEGDHSRAAQGPLQCYRSSGLVQTK
jgi:hypothetical protein